MSTETELDTGSGFQPTESNLARFIRRFRKQKLAIVSLALLLVLLVLAIWRDSLMTYTIVNSDFANLGCTAQFFDNSENFGCTDPDQHFLGTTEQGRDILSRVIYGARITLIASLIGVGSAAAIGLPIGLLAGYLGGRFDRAVMWVVDIAFSLPSLLIAFGMIAVFGRDLTTAMLAVGVGFSTRYARLARGVVLAEREELYVDGARVGGLSTRTIVFRHILPNVAPPLIVQTSLLFGAVILVEAQLSFVGISGSGESPSWGRQLSEARNELSVNPWSAFPPGIAIALTVLAWNLLGDGLRDSLGRDISTNQLSTSRKRSWFGRGSEEPARSEGSSVISDEIHKNAAISLRNVTVEFPTGQGDTVTVLRDVSYACRPGMTLGIVGESGSGKSMSVLAAMGIVPAPGRVSGGEININGKDIARLDEDELARLRGPEIAMIFQEPIASLNPALTVGQQLIQPIQRHLGLSKKDAWAKATELLRQVRVPDPERRMNEYPHQFSGGMAQRVGIARALSCDPKVLIADEPTTALDVTVQGTVIELLKEIQAETGVGIIFITHDLGVVAEVADRVCVMYAGEVVEAGEVRAVFDAPTHPYTRALLETLPHHGRQEDGRLPVIAGLVPSPSEWPNGCRFNPRCVHATPECADPGLVELQTVVPSHYSRCLRIDEIAAEVEA